MGGGGEREIGRGGDGYFFEGKGKASTLYQVAVKDSRQGGHGGHGGLSSQKEI